MAQTITFATNQTIKAGEDYVPSVAGKAVPPNLHTITINIDVAQVPSTVEIAEMLQWSYDAGVTWRDEGGISCVGGPYTPFKGTGTTTIHSQELTVPQNPYPQFARIRTNAPQTEVVSVTGTIN